MALPAGEMWHLDLCSGIGAMALGIQRAGYRTCCYCEIERYCQQVLVARMRDGSLHGAPLWEDIRDFDGRPWAGVDLLSAGWPCQPHSLAGKRKGAADDRNLWPEVIRLIREIRPRACLLENVPGLLTSDGGRMFGRVLGDLAECGLR